MTTPVLSDGVEQPLLVVEGLRVSARSQAGTVELVRGVSFALKRAETLALVGESGSGKSMTCHAIAGLLDRPLRVSGSVVIAGTQTVGLSERQWNRIRGKSVAVIFQNPHNALNPVLTVGRQIAETIVQHRSCGYGEAMRDASRLLDMVRIPAATARLHAYPHQLSGGMCQRVAIAMAISCRPELLIADEPTTALDVTVQAEIISLLHELQRDLGMAMLLVTHDLGVAAHTANDILVMYGGQCMELAAATELFKNPSHPYTLGLMGASPHRAVRGEPLPAIPGTVPALSAIERGCPFRMRCDRAVAACETDMAAISEIAPRHLSACPFSRPAVQAA